MDNEKLYKANGLAGILDQLNSDLNYLECDFPNSLSITLHGTRFNLDLETHQKVKKICLDFLHEKRKNTQTEFDNL